MATSAESSYLGAGSRKITGFVDLSGDENAELIAQYAGSGSWRLTGSVYTAVADVAAKTFTQPAHGIPALKYVCCGASGWALAQADAAATLACGFTLEVTTDTLVIRAIGGVFITIEAHGMGSPGDRLKLSATSAGESQSTVPASGWDQDMGQVIDADTILLQSFKVRQI